LRMEAKNPSLWYSLGKSFCPRMNCALNVVRSYRQAVSLSGALGACAHTVIPINKKQAARRLATSLTIRILPRREPNPPTHPPATPPAHSAPPPIGLCDRLSPRRTPSVPG